jgi:branched-subunit amino acid transport protein
MSGVPVTIGLIILGMGIVTYATRLAPILLLEYVEMGALARRALRFVPPAVLSALIFPELLLPGGALNLSLGNPRLLAGALAALIAWRTKNMLLAIAVGMLALWFLQAVLPR